MIQRRATLLLASALAVGPSCSPRVQPEPRAARPQPPTTTFLRDVDWGRFRSQRQGLSLPLPDGKTWRIDDHSDRWLEAVHPPTATRIRARTWIAPKPVSREHCEAQARSFAPDLPVIEGAAALDDRISHDLFAPDFTSRVRVGIGEADPVSGVLEGHVLVFGAAGRRCVAFALSTRVQGPKGAEELADRLEIGVRIAEGTLYADRLPAGPLEPMRTPGR